MSKRLVFTLAARLQRGRHGRRKLLPPTTAAPSALPPGRVPRVARLLALAIKFDGLIREGGVTDYTAIARLGHVSTARVSQIMNLVLLAPDIQEEILFLPRTVHGRDPIRLHHLQPIALTLDWHKQRAQWRHLRGAAV
jgi:hypothetical protein